MDKEHHKNKQTMDNRAIKIKKRLICFFGCFLFLYCANIKKNNQNSIIRTNSKEYKNIINAFLDTILKTKKYDTYKDYNIVVMEEGSSKLSSYYTYKYCYNSNLNTKKDIYFGCEYDIDQMAKLKKEFKEEIPYLWKRSDFLNSNIEILKTEDLRKSIRMGNYTELPKRLLIYFSVPLIVEKDKAFFYFDSGNSFFGFTTIESVIVLMKKNKKNKWVIDSYYFDPNMTW